MLDARHRVEHAAGAGHAGASQPGRQAGVLHGARRAGRARHQRRRPVRRGAARHRSAQEPRQGVGQRLVELRLVPRRRPHRQRDVDLRDRSAPDDSARRHVRADVQRPSTDQRILNWSAVRGSNTDFNNNSRGIQGGKGFATETRTASTTPRWCSTTARLRASATRSTRCSEWVATVRAPIVPQLANATRTAARCSRTNCASCHGGAKWTKSQTLPLFDRQPATNSGCWRCSRRTRSAGLLQRRRREAVRRGRGRQRAAAAVDQRRAGHAQAARQRRHVQRGEPDSRSAAPPRSAGQIDAGLRRLRRWRASTRPRCSA